LRCLAQFQKEILNGLFRATTKGALAATGCNAIAAIIANLVTANMDILLIEISNRNDSRRDGSELQEDSGFSRSL